MYSERRGRAVTGRALVHCGEHYNALASCATIEVATLPASKTAEEGSLHATQAVRARVFAMLQVLLPADSFEEGAGDALVAPWLGQEVEGALRAELVEVAFGLVAAARGEEVGVRRAVLEAEGQRGQRGLAVRLRATSSSDGQRRDSR